MQADAVERYHWMTDGEFLNAVALGQATPGPVVQTIAVVGYAAHGLGGALLAAFVAFAPSFWFIALGAERFDRLRTNPNPRAFLDGAGPAAIGAILGSAIPLTLALTENWQYVFLAVGAVLLTRAETWRRADAPDRGGRRCLALAGAPLRSDARVKSSQACRNRDASFVNQIEQRLGTVSTRRHSDCPIHNFEEQEMRFMVMVPGDESPKPA